MSSSIKTSNLSKYFNLLAMIICVSSSADDPKAKYRNWINSFLDFLTAPSAILEGIETAALLI